MGKLVSFWMGAMHSLETIVEIRVLARQGKSIGEIQRELGVSRNTVRRSLPLSCLQRRTAIDPKYPSRISLPRLQHQGSRHSMKGCAGRKTRALRLIT